MVNCELELLMRKIIEIDSIIDMMTGKIIFCQWNNILVFNRTINGTNRNPYVLTLLFRAFE